MGEFSLRASRVARDTCTRTWGAGLLLCMLAGCVDSCGCGSSSGAASAAVATGIAGAASAALAAPSPKPPYESTRTPLADAPQTRELARIQAALQAALQEPSTQPIASPQALHAQLPDTLLGFVANGDAFDGPTRNDGHDLAVSSRRYARGSEELTLTITDTVQASPMRAPLIADLTQVAGGDWGTQQGALIGEQPAIVKRFRSGGVTATLIVGGRYLFELRSRANVSDADLTGLVIALPLSALGVGAAGAAGQGG